MPFHCTKSILVAGLLATTPTLAGATCHHCPPEPTIGGQPQATDDVLMQNGVNWAEQHAAEQKAIMAYTGWDPAVRFAQFIIWFARTAGPNIPTQSGATPQPDTYAGDAEAELVLAQGKDNLFGEHRVVVPIETRGFIANGQAAYVQTRSGQYPLRVITAASPIKGYGGYLMLTGYAPSGEQVFYGIPSGEKDLEWVYPVVRVVGTKPKATAAKLYSEKGRAVRKR